jgi:hypothetical protein
MNGRWKAIWNMKNGVRGRTGRVVLGNRRSVIRRRDDLRLQAHTRRFPCSSSLVIHSVESERMRGAFSPRLGVRGLSGFIFQRRPPGDTTLSERGHPDSVPKVGRVFTTWFTTWFTLAYGLQIGLQTS